VSEAVAARVSVAGAAKTEPFVGLEIPIVGGTLADWTLIVPVIKGWTEQWNGKLPAEVNVCVKVAPVPSTPDSHRPVSLVVEWGEPAHVHLTESLTLMLTLVGEKAKFTMLTLAVVALKASGKLPEAQLARP
jgi:hypothetical protein